jgi:hypothetical protein
MSRCWKPPRPIGLLAARFLLFNELLFSSKRTSHLLLARQSHHRRHHDRANRHGKTSCIGSFVRVDFTSDSRSVRRNWCCRCACR